MRRILTHLARRRVAQLVALLYLVGCILPSAALAFADGAVTAYCFEDIAEIAGSRADVHVHSDGTVHHHAAQKPHGIAQAAELPEETGTGTGKQSHSHDSNCCGLFGFTAVLPILAGATDELTTYHVQPLVLTDCLVGCDPGPIDRPPIFSLSM
jgi:hypothetical protein